MALPRRDASDPPKLLEGFFLRTSPWGFSEARLEGVDLAENSPAYSQSAGGRELVTKPARRSAFIG
jgi:hypothetical protein